MRRLTLWLLMFAVGLTVSAPAAERFTIHDSGQPREFELALDEVYIGRAAVPVTPATDRTALTTTARQRRGQLILYEAGAPRNEFTRRLVTSQLLIQLAPGADDKVIAARAGLVSRGAVKFAPGCFLFEAPDGPAALLAAPGLRRQAGVKTAEPLLARQRHKRWIPNDPLFTNQWHLLNTGTGGAVAGVDGNVTNVWNTYRGAGIRIGIVDDGLQFTHPDLAPNADTTIDWDFNGNDADPTPSGSIDFHGTACAGVAAARGGNGIGVSGAAPLATLVGLRLISLPATDFQEAAAMAHSNDLIFVKSNSWGPADSGAVLEAPGTLTAAAFAQAVQTGRGGRGTIFTWAGGNGRAANDNANYDGFANSIYTIAVAAVSDQGQQASYSEPGACLVVAAPSSSSGRPGITTVDLVGANGYSTTDYDNDFGGTSSACPLVAGVVALLLEANPELGWRDVQEILIRSATQNSPADADWYTNAAGLSFNHKFGAGLVNAGAAVARGLSWTNLAPQTSVALAQTGLSVPIPDNNVTGITRTFDLGSSNLRVEHVTVTVSISHLNRGDLAVTLVSPSGTASRLAELHSDTGNNYVNWKFMSVRNWGEESGGTWTVQIADRKAGTSGTLTAIGLEVFGTEAGPPQPRLAVQSTALDDAGYGNDNQQLDPGETIFASIVLTNTGAATATAITGTLHTAQAGITFLQAQALYPDLLPGQHGANVTPFVYRLDKTVPCGALVTFTNIVTTATRAFTNVITHVVGTNQIYGATTNEFTSADVPQSIPNLTTVYSTNAIALAGAPVVDRLTVSVRLNHTYNGDLILALQHPDGTEVVLANRRGGSGDNFGSATNSCAGGATFTRFDDAAASAISAGSAPFAGTYRPETPLAVFAGKPLNGLWRLRITDAAAADTGTLGCWSLTAVAHEEQTICVTFNQPPTANPLAVTTAAATATNLTLTGSDADADPIGFLVVTNPAHGELTNFDSVTGAVTYTPTNAAAGTDSFTYATTDGYATSAVAQVAITITLPANPDTDNDGLPDAWEMMFFGNLAQAGDDDTDGDGLTNLQELTAGTNPADPASALRITAIAIEGADCRITWQAIGGRTNRVQFTPALNIPFTDLSGDFVLPGNGLISTNYLDVGGATQFPSRNYRIRLKP